MHQARPYEALLVRPKKSITQIKKHIKAVLWGGFGHT